MDVQGRNAVASQFGLNFRRLTAQKHATHQKNTHIANMGNTTATLHFPSAEFYLNTYGGDLRVSVSTGPGPYDHDASKQTYILLKQRGVNDPLAVVPLKGSARPQRRDVTFSRSHLIAGKSYYCVWTTCLCDIAKPIAQTDFDVAVEWDEPDKDPPNMPAAWYLLREAEKEVFRKTFNAIDRSGDGFISSVELHDYYQKTIHDDLTHAEVRAMMQEADLVDIDGKIELAEFFLITMRAKNHDTSLKWKKLESLFESELLRAAKKQKI